MKVVTGMAGRRYLEVRGFPCFRIFREMARVMTYVGAEADTYAVRPPATPKEQTKSIRKTNRRTGGHRIMKILDAAKKKKVSKETKET